MKLTKYLLFACSALVLVSCGNDEDFNTANDVTVQMANATISTKENKKLFYVPLEVVGKANGPIRVTVEMTPASENPADEDKHYLATSKTVIIPDNDATVSIEFAPVNDKEINEDRAFKVSIVKAEGAIIGEQNSTEVIIRDDDSMPYEAIQGEWTLSYINASSGSAGSFKITLEGVEDDNILYEHVLYATGWGGSSGLTAEVGYSIDDETGEVTLDFGYGQTLGQESFSGLGTCDVVLFGYNGNLISQGSCQAIVDPKLRTATFDPTDIIYLIVSAEDGLYGWIPLADMGMSRE